MDGVGFGVGGGNIEGFPGPPARALTRPTESERGGAARVVFVSGCWRAVGGEARCGDMYVASRDIWRWDRKETRACGGQDGSAADDDGDSEGLDMRIIRKLSSCSSVFRSFVC